MARSSVVAHKVADYTVLPLAIPAIPSFPQQTTHYTYVRPHAPKLPSPDSPRSMFFANVPIDATEVHFRTLFAEQLGGARVEHVEFDEARPSKRTAAAAETGGITAKSRKGKRREVLEEELATTALPGTWNRDVHASGSCAVVVFVDRASCEAAWKSVKKAVKNNVEIVWGKGVGEKVSALGSARYHAHAQLVCPSASALQSIVDTYMTNFGSLEATRARAQARARAEPDADGFVTVTKGARSGPARLAEAKEVLEKQRERERIKTQDMQDFYRFQVREKNKARARELVAKFEEDRKRVEGMRRSGGVVPE